MEIQRQWADTDAVRDMEDEGDRAIDHLMNIKRQREAALARATKRRLSVEAAMFKEVESVLLAPWSIWSRNEEGGRWKLSQYTDNLHRRILLVPNDEFDDHHSASYQGGLEKDRERSETERREQQDTIVRNAALIEEKGEDGALDKEIGEEGEEGEEGESFEEEDEDFDDEEDYFMVRDSSMLQDEFAWARQQFVWGKKEKIVMACDVVKVSPAQSLTGSMLLTTQNIYFHPEKLLDNNSFSEEPVLEPCKEKDCRWPLNRIVTVYGRRYILRPHALEIFFVDTNEVFISFEGGVKVRDKFWAKVSALKTKNIAADVWRNIAAVAPMFCPPACLHVFKFSSLATTHRPPPPSSLFINNAM